MNPSKPNLDDQLLICLFMQLSHVAELQQTNKSNTTQMVCATQSLKNLADTIAALKISGVVKIDQESAPVLLDRINTGINDEKRTESS